MPTLTVLFERSLAIEPLGAALATAAGAPARRAAEGGSLELDGVAVRVELRAGPVTGPGIIEAAAGGGWRGADAAIARHGAFVRLHAVESDLAREPLQALWRLTRGAASLLALPGALALFCDEGRVLSEAGAVLARLADGRGAPPVELWVALRRFELADARGHFLDTLGMEQLGLRDLEAYAADGAAADATAAWLRNLCLYQAQEEPPARLRHGDTLDGPDDQPWAAAEDTATAPPTRRALRFTPLDAGAPRQR